MEIVHFIYNEKSIDFQPNGNDNVMVNATQMAKLFDKDLFQFTKSENTKNFISSCLKPANAGLLGIKTEEDLIISKQKSGTWMHRVLALKFSAWLNSDFEVWVFYTIDQIILGHYREIKQATIDKVRAEQQLENKRQQLLKEHPEVFSEYLEIESKIGKAQNRKNKASKLAINQIKMDLFDKSAD